MSKDINEYLPMPVRNFMAFRTPQRLALYRMLSALIKGRTPIDVCLRHLYDRKNAKKRPDAYIIKKWLRKMDSGEAFHDAIKDEVPAQERILIACGSQSDSLADGIDQAINATTGVQKIQGVLKSGLAQPVFLMIIVCFMLIGFAKYMAPDFAKMLPEAQWSGYSGALLKSSRYIESLWPYMVTAIVCLVIAFLRSLTRWTGKTRDKVDKFFPYSIYKSYNSSSFLIALSGLLRSGIPLDSALKRIMSNSSAWMKWHIRKMLINMERGEDMGNAMDTGLIDDETTDQLYIYAKSADFSKALKELGEQAIDNGIESITKQTAVGKIVALFCVGASVLWIQLSMLDLQTKLSASTGAPTQNAQPK